MTYDTASQIINGLFSVVGWIMLPAEYEILFLFVCLFISIKMLYHVSLRLMKISSNYINKMSKLKKKWWFLYANARTADQGHNRVPFSKWNEHLTRMAWQFSWRQDRQIAHIPIDIWNEGGWNWYAAKARAFVCGNFIEYSVPHATQNRQWTWRWTRLSKWIMYIGVNAEMNKPNSGNRKKRRTIKKKLQQNLTCVTYFWTFLRQHRHAASIVIEVTLNITETIITV